MTTEQFEKAKEIDSKIKRLKSFCAYYKKYNVSIHLSNDSETSFHSETFHLKDDDKELYEIIKKYVNGKLERLKKDFNSI